MKTIAAALLALGLATGAAHAASSTVFDDLGATAPRSAFSDLADSAPRSPFDQIRDTAPRSGFFTNLDRTAP